MALAVGVVGPLGPERAVGGIGSIRSSRHAPRPVAARKAGISENLVRQQRSDWLRHARSGEQATGTAAGAAAAAAAGSIGVRSAHRCEKGIFLVAYWPPSPTKLRGRTLMPATRPLRPQGACDPHGKGRRPRPLV
jgi:antitoxin (DNA-binding transcriptional repressor) of toxin-antitoxin stability system